MTELAKIFLLSWLAILAAIVGYKLLTGRIATRGLLRLSEDGPISPERVQLLVLSLAAVFTFASRCVATRSLVSPTEFELGAAGGSQAVYLVTKYFRKTPQRIP